MACRILGNIYKLIIWAAISVFRSQSFCLSFSSHKKGFPLKSGRASQSFNFSLSNHMKIVMLSLSKHP